MDIKAYPLYAQAVALQPAPAATRGKSSPLLDGELAFASATQQGWLLLCPLAFEATWNGGPRAEDTVIRLDGAPAGPAFVQSQLGNGVLTFYPGYQFKTEGEQLLWLRGPINAPKDGVYPLESTVDASLLPCTVSMHWQFTAPNQTVRFAAGEPFATLLLYPKSDLEPVQVEVMPIEQSEQAHVQAFQQLVDNPALQGLFRGLGVTPVERTQSKWASQLVNPPPVSCLCPTYGRVELLEEAIYSFLQQDYPGQKELIVLNDYDQQTLVFDHPEVRVVNLPNRFHSVGEKYKAAVALASHDLIFVWHDDDIYLLHRLSHAVAHLDQNTAFFKADQAWFWNDGQVSGPERNLFHGGSCWRRNLFRKVQGYPYLDNQYDVEFERLCQAEAPGAFQVDPIKAAEIYYIYRWNGTKSYHLSAMGADGQEQQKVAAYVAQQVARGQIPQGQVQLKPHWRTDYTALVQTKVAALPAKQEDKWSQVEEIPFPPPVSCHSATTAAARRTGGSTLSRRLPAQDQCDLTGLQRVGLVAAHRGAICGYAAA